MKDLISIIMPCYNAERYIANSINSILKQTYGNLELIVVNDGSDDNTLKICNKKADNDSRMKILNIPNGGVSNARNMGMKNSNGKYIMFIDADDVFLENMVEKMYNTLIKEKVDAVKCMYLLSNNQKIVENIRYGKYENDQLRKELLHYILSEKMKCYLWTLLVKKEYIVELNDDFCIYEDLIFYLEFIMKINSLYIIKENLYIYNINNVNSLTKTNYVKKIYNMLNANNQIEKILKLNKLDCMENKKMINTRIFTNIINYLYFIQYINGFKIAIKEYKKLLKNIIFIQIKNNYSCKYVSAKENIFNYLVRKKIYFAFYAVCVIKNIKNKKGSKK